MIRVTYETTTAHNLGEKALKQNWNNEAIKTYLEIMGLPHPEFSVIHDAIYRPENFNLEAAITEIRAKDPGFIRFCSHDSIG